MILFSMNSGVNAFFNERFSTVQIKENVREKIRMPGDTESLNDLWMINDIFSTTYSDNLINVTDYI